MMFYIKQQLRVSKMVQQEKVLAIKPDDLSSIPGPLVVEGENRTLQLVLRHLFKPLMGIFLEYLNYRHPLH